MLNIYHKTEMVDAVIEKARHTHKNPFEILKESIHRLGLSDDDEKRIYLECKKILQSKNRKVVITTS